MPYQRKLSLFIAMSLDGYIAKPDGDLSFLSLVQQEGEDYGYEEFMSGVDTVIIGRKTYDAVLAMGYDFPHSTKESYIITHTPRESIGSVQFYTGNLPELVRTLKNRPGGTIFCDGGAVVVNELLREYLIDEFIIFIIPILLGEGIRLFRDERPETRLQLVSAQHFSTGLVQLRYQQYPDAAV